ncbi:MAG: ATP-dependent DNA helicase [Methanobrevibacter sp. CfCl-M3]
MKISEVLEDGEKEDLEFKTSLAEKDDVMKNISAFSNKHGGTILIGVNNNCDVVGVDIGKNTLEKLANDIRRETDPPIFPRIDYIKYNDKNIIVIEVYESNTKPVFYRDKAYIRVGRTKQKLSSTEIRNLITNENKVTSWDEQIIEDASPEDIDNESVSNFLKLSFIKRKRVIDPETPIEEALNKLNLIKKGKLTNASILLFGLNPQKFVSQAVTQCAKFKSTNTNEFEDMHDFKGNVINQINDAIDFVLKHIKNSAKIESIERLEKLEYPLEAIRESIINAICHRDYRINSNVQIRIFEDRIEIWGCGPLPQPLSVENLKISHNSIRINPLIAECLYDIGFIEKWGTGIERIIKSCIDNGLPEPIFEIKSGSLVVTLSKYKFINFEKIKINERQQKAINHLKIYGRITNKEYRELNPKFGRHTALNDLKDLIKKEIIIVKNEGRNTYYILV